ncbi:heterogeneous nuclear ribonucleoprotein K [Toxorhynchites rutilus septentrionalis]|uniref:heterogeneous nuclear ribonucleoprotein K n=1 Tax=Toxorhynchites rutilus septentrionalis TaxID=329112 RepID=UPI00247849B4|nr:heterogeneous nuclear ribonucleoprotein K [Toxorhynchites rutilus septentrionalis]XP_055628653.1 heterogeneous nuclear ribonucleoprotein K [Toxorhynchites rutilus septentrionalis]
MKRDHDENQEDDQHQEDSIDSNDNMDKKAANKRSRVEEEEVRLLIPSKMAGAIIGKGGHNIQKLRTEYQAQVNVGDCTGPERVITIGADMETVTKVVKDIMKHLDKAGENEFELRILVHQSLAGCVIGRGGTKIKEIKDQIGCRLKIFSNIAPQSTDRVAQVVGSEEQCLTALNEIIGLIKGTPIKGPVHNYDPHNYDDMYADEYGGYGVGGGSGNNFRNGGRGGGGNAGGGGGGGAGTGFDRRDRFDDRRVGGGGGGGGGGRGYDRDNDRGRGGMRDREFINPWAPNVNGSQMGGANFGGGGGSLGMGGLGAMNMGGSGGNMGNLGGMGNMGNGNMGGFGGNSSNMDNKTSTQVTIPKDLAGAIIGKGGGRIRRIRNESNAFIQIDEALPGSTDRIITITGTPKEIQAAQYMLQQSVRENLSGGGSGFNRN